MPMATPTLRHDQHVLHIPPPLMNLNSHPSVQEQWRSPLPGHHADHGSRLKRSVAVPLCTGPVLPTIASLLHGAERDAQSSDESKRKYLATRRGDFEFRESVHERIRASPSAWNYHSPLPAVSNIPVHHAVYQTDKASPQLPLDARSRVRPTPIETSSRYISQVLTQQNPLDSSPFRLSHDPAGRRRLFYHHSIDPLEMHVPSETPGVPHIYNHGLCRKHMRSGRFHRQLSPPHTHVGFLSRHEAEGIDMSVQKRRRVITPTPIPRQSLYESEYGLTVLETSKSLMGSRYIPSIEPTTGGSMSAPRRRYVRGNLSNMEKFDSPTTVSSRITYSGNEGVLRTTATATETTTLTPGLCKQTNVEKREPFPITTLVLKSQELLKSNSLVRNHHDEIDWVATFLNIGFESSSIYALMCPLRKGRWKREEENYTMGLLRLIENGTILLRHGQSIRGYIGEKLHSDDMRVLKKLSNCKMFHFAKLINPRLAEEEKVDMSVVGAREGLERLEQLKGDFLRSVQLEALVAVRKHLSDSSLRDLVTMRA